MRSTYKQVGYGSQGEDVKTLQEMLNSSGYSLDVDGVFGSKTQAAVKDYQQKIQHPISIRQLTQNQAQHSSSLQ